MDVESDEMAGIGTCLGRCDPCRRSRRKVLFLCRRGGCVERPCGHDVARDVHGDPVRPCALGLELYDHIGMLPCEGAEGCQCAVIVAKKQRVGALSRADVPGSFLQLHFIQILLQVGQHPYSVGRIEALYGTVGAGESALLHCIQRPEVAAPRLLPVARTRALAHDPFRGSEGGIDMCAFSLEIVVGVERAVVHRGVPELVHVGHE